MKINTKINRSARFILMDTIHRMIAKQNVNYILTVPTATETAKARIKMRIRKQKTTGNVHLKEQAFMLIHSGVSTVTQLLQNLTITDAHTVGNTVTRTIPFFLKTVLARQSQSFQNRKYALLLVLKHTM
jgi:hypothetical protein